MSYTGLAGSGGAATKIDQELGGIMCLLPEGVARERPPWDTRLIAVAMMR
jgi:hypothetical protein